VSLTGEAGQYDKAIFMYETAVLYNPACAEAHNNLGVIYKVCATWGRYVTAMWLLEYS
jgi:Tfp pilus assembly protein PilF